MSTARLIERELREAYRRLVASRRLVALAERLTAKYKWLHLHHALRYLELLGPEEAEELFSTPPERVMRTIRVNTLLTDTAQLTKRLFEKGFKLRKHPYIGYGLVVEEQPYSIGATLEYLLGLYTIQGPASMLAVPVLKPEESRHSIADCCAGAGVKTTQLAQHNTEKTIIAIDTNYRKLLALRNNASRMAAANIIALNMDARYIHRLGSFDRVLVDAPCSGEGLVVFDKGKWKRSFEDIAGRVKLQYQLLEAAVEALQPGGRLVYATCSLSVEENEYVVSLITRLREDITIVDTGLQYGSPGEAEYLGLPISENARYCRRFYPHRHQTEGFTICLLEKLGSKG